MRLSVGARLDDANLESCVDYLRYTRIGITIWQAASPLGSLGYSLGARCRRTTCFPCLTSSAAGASCVAEAVTVCDRGCDRVWRRL